MGRKETILASARELFAQKGYNATTMDEVAEAAGVNKATVYYYFGSKQKLYEEIMLTTLESMYEYLLRRNSSDDPAEALKGYIFAFYTHAKQDEAFLRILMREIASNGEHLPLAAARLFVRIVGILEEILKKGYQTGVFTVSDVKLVHFLIVGALSYYLPSVPLRQRLAQQMENPPVFLLSEDNLPDALYDFILKGLKR